MSQATDEKPRRLRPNTEIDADLQSPKAWHGQQVAVALCDDREGWYQGTLRFCDALGLTTTHTRKHSPLGTPRGVGARTLYFPWSAVRYLRLVEENEETQS